VNTTPSRIIVAAAAAALLLATGLTPARAVPTAPPDHARPLKHQIVIAHRGASYDNPEHTFFAYDGAVAADTDMIECDLQLTKDGVLVCMHDTTVDRTASGTGAGRVDSLTLAGLRRMDFGSWFNKANPSRAQAQFAGASIVPFEEQLDCYLGLNPRLRFHVETKSPAEYGGRMEPAVVDVLRRKNLLAGGDAEMSSIVIQSFDLASLQRMKQLAPSLPTAFLTPGSTSVPDLTALRPFVDALAPNAAVLQGAPALVDAAHALGMAVHAWTVDDGPTMQALLDMGVDGIFTDRPNVLRGLVKAAGTGIPAAARRNPRSFQHGCPGVAGSVSGPLTPGEAGTGIPASV
jgi:glycerophosphoryl diester phosphodiesterase